MSQVNRYEKSPNVKVARYLHRIQQIVGNRGRTPSPLSSRISKPIKPNSLDSLLKYELTFKILIRFFDKSNRDFMRHFFNNLRSTDQHRKQKIYRFVSIQKTQCAHLHVDTSISTKMLFNFLKKFMNSNLKTGFQSLKHHSTLSESYFVLNTPRSMIARKDKDFSKPAFQIFLYLSNQLKNRKAHFFRLLHSKNNQNAKQLQNNEKDESASLFFKLEVLFTVHNIKYKAYSFYRIKENILTSQNQENQAIHNCFKLKYLVKLKEESIKNQLLRQLKIVSTVINMVKAYQKKNVEQQLSRPSRLKGSTTNIMVSTTSIQAFDSNIYQATIKITSALVCAIMRERADFFKKLQTNSKAKKTFFQKLRIIDRKFFNMNKSSSFYTIKRYSFAQEIIQNLEYAKQMQFGVLNAQVIFEQLERKTYKIGFKYILRKAAFVEKKQKMVSKLVSNFSKTALRHGLGQWKEITKEDMFNSTPLPVNQSGLFRFEAQSLPKRLHKIYTKSLAHAFIKFKGLFREKKGSNKPGRKQSGSWKNDMNNFLKQRETFRTNLQEKLRRVNQIIKEQHIPVLQDGSPLILDSPQRKEQRAL